LLALLTPHWQVRFIFRLLQPQFNLLKINLLQTKILSTSPKMQLIFLTPHAGFNRYRSEKLARVFLMNSQCFGAYLPGFWARTPLPIF
jgi:hypothetical protein